MIQVSQLTKEKRIEEIHIEICKKTVNSMSFTPFQSIIEPLTLIQIVESIEDRVYFISESPTFEFKGINYICQNTKCDNIEDFKKLMDNHPNEFFVIYNIMLTNGIISNGIISNAPVISQNQCYMIRGVFIEDPLIKREQVIDKILEK